MSLALRPYQAKAIGQARALVRAGKRAPLLAGPPGLGKTTLGAAILCSAIAKGGRGAWLAHRHELCDQAERTIAATGAPTDRWVVQTYQSVVARGEAPEADVVIFDEAHWLGQSAEEWKRIPEAYSDSIRIGLSATPERGDGSALAGFDCIVPVSSYSELIGLGFLVPCNVIAPDKRLKAREIICPPVDAYLAHCRGELAVCFGPSVEACQRFVEEFRGLGVPAEVVHAQSTDRADVLARWRRRETLVVANVGILTEGFDYPEVSCVILARNIGTCGFFLQTTGRGIRAAPGKTKATLLDLAGATHLHGSPTADREYALDGVGIRELGAPSLSPQCSICGNPPPCECGGREQLEIAIKGTVADLKPWQVAMRKEGSDERAERLAAFLSEARSKGDDPRSALFKYRYCYGFFPSAGTRSAAKRLLERRAVA